MARYIRDTVGLKENALTLKPSLKNKGIKRDVHVLKKKKRTEKKKDQGWNGNKGEGTRYVPVFCRTGLLLMPVMGCRPEAIVGV